MIVHTRIEGTRLAGNLLGDPTERDLFVYLPPGYEASDRRYPVAYLLHAFGQDARQLVHPPTDGRRWSPPLEDVLDPVFGRMGTSPLIVVVPDGDTAYGCGQWVDSPVTGAYQQYLVHDVVGHVDRTYRTLPYAASRGVLGFSSGGAGAWNLGSQYPGTFGAVAMLSGDAFLDISLKPMLHEYLTSIWPEPPAGPVEGNDLSRLVYAYSAAYSPAPDRPPHYADLPVEFPTGALRPEVWDRWLRYDPVVNWQERVDNLRLLRGILLDVGAGDEHNLQWAHRLLSHQLTEAGIEHRSTENTGNHGGRSRERTQVALQWLAGVLIGE
jgi:enterochelin esterase-like enzyme